MGRCNRVLTAVVLGLGLSLVGAHLAVAGIANTKHNLSASASPADRTYKATSEQQLCVFCHTPHNASPETPLWNHALSSQTYTPYSSPTLVAAAPGQPTGTSKLCLSCHDGTLALGSVHVVLIASQDTVVDNIITGLNVFISGAANLGIDLRNDHPVSFTYDSALATSNPELVDPATLTGKIKPDSTGQGRDPAAP